jgi:hypothetical protein
VASASFSAFGAFISAMKTVIDPTVKVARSSRIVSMATAGSNRCMSTSGAPVSRQSAMCPMSPVMWNSGATPRTTSSGPMPIQSR